MLEIKSNTKVETSSEKSFGLVFSLVFSIIGLYPLINSNTLYLWPFIVAFIFLFLAFFLPKSLSIPNKLWFKFGIMLGTIIAPIIMALVYFIAVLPTGMIMKLLGKDLLKKKFDKNVKTYWIKRDQPIGSMKNQF